VYSAQRLALFVAALLALFWLHLGGWLLVLLAAIIAWALSYVLLGRSRDRAALWIAERVEARRSGARPTDPDAEAEDAEADAGGPRPDGAVGSERQPEPQEDAVAELEQAGAGQDGAQQDPARAEQHRGGQQRDGQGEQQHEQ
jgi:hypothetical protein